MNKTADQIEFELQVLEMFYKRPRIDMDINWNATGTIASVKVGDHPVNGHGFGYNSENDLLSFEGQDCYWDMPFDYWDKFKVFFGAKVPQK